MKLVKNNPAYWDFIHYLRFHPDNLDGFVDKEPVTIQQQANYMAKHGDDYQICLDGDVPVGFVGIVDGDIRVAVHPEHKNKGIGVFMLKAVSEKPHSAKILLDNEASLKLFIKCGYKVTGWNDTFYYLRLKR